MIRGCVFPIFVGIVIAAGCSSSSPPAQAFVYATLTPTTCGSCAGIGGMTPFLQIGNMGTTGDVANRVADGGVNHISCDVKGSGSTYSISITATSQSMVTQTSAGSMVLTGNNISSSGGTNLEGLFVGTNTQGQYTANNCTLTFSTPEGPGGIAPGRIWGHIDCPGATNGSAMVSGGLASTCTVDVDFVFENCSS
jgi:hypothetical protein